MKCVFFWRWCLALCMTTSQLAMAQLASDGKSDDPSPLAWQVGVDTQSTLYSMSGTWWNLAAATDPSFETSRTFGELWVHPRLNAQYAINSRHLLYGALSAGWSKTLSSDAFNNNSQSAVRIENANLGFKGSLNADWSYDVSAGRQPFVLGTGMLLAAGSSNGGDWGAAASSPRKAWGRTALAKVGVGELTGSLFHLEPAELTDTRTDTRLQGVSLEWNRDKVGRAGLAWFTASKSTAIYPGDLAPLAYIESGRKGLDTWHGWFNMDGVIPSFPDLSIRAEFARQSNQIQRVNGRTDPMEAKAWLVGASYWAKTLPFAPKFTYNYARFSGDNPATSTYERFDPMYWGNGLDNYWFGANGSYAWLNANIKAHRFTVDAYASPQDIIQLQFVRTHADQLNSAIQYGQGMRFGGASGSTLLVGVPHSHLSDEIYLQYVRVFSPKWIGLMFVSRSFPGDGLKAIAPQGTKPWTTIGFGLTASF
jgi:hypothetical protein